MNACKIIAEAGVNHNGDISVARRLIDAAADAGGDYVKFQTFDTSQLLTRDAPKAGYQRSTTQQDESQFDMIRKLELSESDHMVLLKHCEEVGIGFASTGFDHRSIEVLSRFNLDFFKIPSGEITNVPYLRNVGKRARPTILSTGMATLSEIELAIEILEESGTSRNQITVLHCNTEYPTPLRDVNLRAMQTIRKAFNVEVGYSDHTVGIEIPIAAVALGASVIEKHFTLDRSLPGPDHAASLEPNELKAMVDSIRNIEQAMGDGIKRPSQSESPTRAVARKSIVAATDIMQGEILNESNLTVKRPGTGISPAMWDELIGRRASRSYVADELIQW